MAGRDAGAPAASAREAILESLDAGEAEFLAARLRSVSLGPGATFIREGDQDSDLYFVDEGRVELSKGAGGERTVLGEQGAGALLGELSFLDDSPRSVSVTTLEPTRLSILPKAAFVEGDPTALAVRQHLERGIALLSTQRLRATNDDLVNSLRREIGLLRTQIDFGVVFVVMVLMFGLSAAGQRVIETQFAEYYYYDGAHYTFLSGMALSWIGFLIFASPTIYLVRRIDFPIRSVVTSTTRLRRSMLEATALSALVVGVVLAAAFELLSIPGIAPLNERFDQYWLLTLATPDYLFHCYIQELVARGIMQNAVQRFLRDESGHRTVIASSVAFAIMHLHLGFATGLATGFAGLLFGYLYLRWKNLFAVTLFHWVVGVFGLRLPSVLAHLANG